MSALDWDGKAQYSARGGKMKTGDIVTDSRAQAWTLGALLGEGAWGTSWLVRDDDARQRVLKVPFEAGELPPTQEGRAALMRDCAKEQAELLAREPLHFLALDDRIILPTGGVALLLPHLPSTLLRQLQSGLPLIEAVDLLHAVSATLSKLRRTHGNLRPSNILIDPSGSPVLCDASTASTGPLLPAAERTQPDRKRWAPEDRVGVDAWAICQMLYAAVMLDEQDGDGSLPAPPLDGLDKITLADLKDRAVARLRRDGANPRFINRTADRLAALLARGLSEESDPSPPYRFLKASDLAPRLAEVLALTRPGIASVGKLLLASGATGDVFHGPGPVGFSVSVSPTEGVTESDDLVCGVRLTDLDAPSDSDGRVSLEDAQFAVDKHPSGRFRFEFNLPDVDPGRYAVRVAFSIKDSGVEPIVVDGRFQVRPPPGYVPAPKPDEGPEPIQLTSIAPKTPAPSDLDEDDYGDAPTVRMSRTEYLAEEKRMAEVVEAFPRPLAPTSPGASFEPEPETEPSPLRPGGPPPPLAAVPTPPPSTAGALTEAPPEPPQPVPHDTRSQAPQPSVTIAAPQLAEPVPVALPPPAPVPTPLDPAQPWPASQAHEGEFFNGDEAALPGSEQEDLLEPGSVPKTGAAAAVHRLRELVQRDSPTAIGVAIAACFLLLVLMMALLRAC